MIITFLRRLLACVAAALAVLVAPAIAFANTITSTNWSGYAAHRSGVKFHSVTATWRQPAASCSSGTQTFSSFWVGIGGYSLSSDALEQVGTELDCNADNTQSISAWYELVPAPTRTVRMTIAGGDVMRANVTVVGDSVTVKLTDRTRGESFARTIVDHSADASSAEWITEAPSDCSSSSQCQTLPLANFGAVRFAEATATTTGGRTSSIANPQWTTTKILLGYYSTRNRFVAKTTTANATPSKLQRRGHAFRIAYSGSTASSGSATTTGGGFPGGLGGPGGFGGGFGGPGGRIAS